MNETSNPPAIPAEERIAAIQKQRSSIMALATEEKVRAILNTDHPAAVVHAFPEHDFLLLVEEIGPDDAGELIALASNRQWEHLVDARIWQDDRIDLEETTRWLDRLCRADFRRAIRWLTQEKPEFFELYLFRNINIIVREPEVEPAVMPDGFFSFDQTFYMEIPELPPRINGEARDTALRQELLHDLLSRLASDDHLMLQRILLEAVRVLPAEAEEEEYRLRCVRMAEKGFLPFEEAIGIYQPLNPEDMARATKRPSIPKAETGAHSAPLYPIQRMPRGNVFSRALAAVDAPEVLAGLQTEFATLCNRLIMADRQSVRDADDLARTVQKACGYLHLGLGALSSGPDADAPAIRAALIRRHNLERIFRVGYGRCLKLKWRAEKWRKQSWFARAGLALTFWDEAWTGVLGGLLLKRPLFFDEQNTGATRYREFADEAELKQTEAVLSRIEAMDDFLADFPTALERTVGTAAAPLTWKSLLLTIWIRSILRMEPIPAPVSAESLQQAFDRLWPNRPTADFTDPAAKAGLLDTLAKRAGVASETVSRRIGTILEALFQELSENYDRVNKTDLDPRHIHHFLVAARQPENMRS